MEEQFTQKLRRIRPAISLALTGVASLSRSTILAVEVILGSALLPASLVGTAIAPGSMIEKIEAGFRAPEELYEMFLGLPDDLAKAERLFDLLESEWTWEKVRTIIGVGYDEIRRIASEELENIRAISQGLKNFREMRTETLSALMSVFCVYGIAIFLLRIIRLQDRDSLGDRMRKGSWRLISGSSETQELCDKIEKIWWAQIDPQELGTILGLGMAELRRRKREEDALKV